ncbi:hypothetical protein [Paenibacillus thiaminolyticus]|uniref:Uncharacterized protein n=1 Tax=Paenibacillus thiaminolyticus TaxID=49283 RepID=A0A3A3H6I1_PANTH|nr:hypothetical protein [Paenibacillus thiaminolyticus]RJG25320.1 hypothetical protein DQX05_07745 [Paenibacillus thiaminolyticus]
MKKRLIASLVSLSMAFAAFTPMAFAAPKPELTQKEGHIIEIGKDEFSKKLLRSLPTMDQYIKLGEDKMEIDPAAKDVVDIDVYNHYQKGVDNINGALRDGSLIIRNGQITASPIQTIQPLWFANTYWWGVAITFDDEETKHQVYALTQTSNAAAALAVIAGTVPGGQAAAVLTALEAIGISALATALDYNNKGNGCTINIHWLPVPWVNVTSNS